MMSTPLSLSHQYYFHLLLHMKVFMMKQKNGFLREYEKKDNMAMPYKIWTNYVYAKSFETPNEEIRYLKQLKEIDDQLPDLYYYTGVAYNKLYQFDKAIPELEKALEIYKN